MHHLFLMMMMMMMLYCISVMLDGLGGGFSFSGPNCTIWLILKLLCLGFPQNFELGDKLKCFGEVLGYSFSDVNPLIWVFLSICHQYVSPALELSLGLCAHCWRLKQMSHLKFVFHLF